ncbi:MAG TPA: NRAMP family divalent metal transporter [Candidatus Binatia bacterium]|nr:NRAMP family divalent metal transporter [Candidatus Binatia bacterium]
MPGGAVPGSAVLDEAHKGDIRGAFGTISEHEHGGRRTWRQRALALAAIMGPGLIVMVGDNDAGGVATYANAGQTYGDSLLWVLLLLVPVLIVNQEMVVRLGAVTGVGHGRLIFERFGRFWGLYAVGDLFLLNFLTIVTEFIGIALGAAYFGVSPYIAVPVGAVLLIGITVTGRFETWERFMFIFLAANALMIPLVVLAHPSVGTALHGFGVPGIQGGLTSNAALLIIAIVGTTVAPWQLFFQQSNVVDKRITPRWINYERTDTIIGAFVVVIGAAAIMITATSAFQGTPLAGHFVDALSVARGLSREISTTLGAVFAIVLIDASIIGASAVTLATSYAFGDVFGIRHSLHRSWRDAKLFYATFTGVVVIAAAIVLLPSAPLGLITTAVQALAGTLLPSASLFLLLLCNDRAVLGPWVNRAWLNILATVIIATLVMLSLILIISTIFTEINITILVIVLAGVLVVGLVSIGALTRGGLASPVPPEEREERFTWRMPPIALLTRPVPSRGRKIGMYSMAGYLVVAILVLLVKAVELGTGH